MTTLEALNALKTQSMPSAGLADAVIQLQAVRTWALAVEQDLQQQQLLEPSTAIDTQLEMLANFYRAIVESMQTAVLASTRALSSMKHLPDEIDRRITAVIQEQTNG
jgi:hypothetical protein